MSIEPTSATTRKSNALCAFRARLSHELERGSFRFAHHANHQVGLLEPGWEMKFVTSLLAAAVLLAGMGASHAAVRIADDWGGMIGNYLDKFHRLRSSGESVVIDGLCASACTLVLGSTEMLYSMYPAPVQHWIAARGGLTPRMIFLRGTQLQAMYQPCDSVRREFAGGYPSN